MLFCKEPKSTLKGTKVLKYIEWGEKLDVDVTRGSNRGKRKLPQLETLQSRDLWYAVPQINESPILFQYLIDKRGRAFWNIAKVHAINIIHYVTPRMEGDVLPLLGYLNSSVSALMVELHGRSYGGGVLKIEAYELKELPVIDPSELNSTNKARISNAFKNLAKSIDNRVLIETNLEGLRSKSKKEKGLFQKEAEEKLHKVIAEERKAQHHLDEVIYDILELSKEERIQVEQGLEELQEIRRSRTQT